MNTASGSQENRHTAAYNPLPAARTTGPYQVVGKPPAVQAPVAELPAVQAGRAETPCEQFLSAAVPAVQSRVAVLPAVQSRTAESAVPGAQAGAMTPLPASQSPDPLAIAPKGARIGDSYFDMCSSPFFS